MTLSIVSVNKFTENGTSIPSTTGHRMTD